MSRVWLAALTVVMHFLLLSVIYFWQGMDQHSAWRLAAACWFLLASPRARRRFANSAPASPDVAPTSGGVSDA